MEMLSKFLSSPAGWPVVGVLCIVLATLLFIVFRSVLIRAAKAIIPVQIQESPMYIFITNPGNWFIALAIDTVVLGAVAMYQYGSHFFASSAAPQPAEAAQVAEEKPEYDEDVVALNAGKEKIAMTTSTMKDLFQELIKAGRLSVKNGNVEIND